jgi:hypothetical protein
MTDATVFSAIKETCKSYLDKLDGVEEDRFQCTPPVGGWSYSEVYDHIFDLSLLSLDTMRDAIQGKGEKKPTAFVVKLILFFGMFPPAKRFKVPSRLDGRVRKINKAEARVWVAKFLAQLEADYATLGHADPAIKMKHPRLGYLNASEWLRFIQIHLNHHLKQLKRIEKSF